MTMGSQERTPASPVARGGRTRSQLATRPVSKKHESRAPHDGHGETAAHHLVEAVPLAQPADTVAHVLARLKASPNTEGNALYVVDDEQRLVGVASLGDLLRQRPDCSLEAFMLALGVAAIPEGLPVVSTAALVRSMGRMRKEGMIVRRVAAAETLGGVTVVCADKTGTLTLNDMRLEVLDFGDHQIAASQATADGGDPLGESTSRLLTAAVLNSDVDIQNIGHGNEISAARPNGPC